MAAPPGRPPTYAAAARGLRGAAVLLAILAAPAAWAQGASGPPAALGPLAPAGLSAADLSAARRAAERAHLWRVGAWGAANVAVGAALLGASSRRDDPQRWAFGVQSAAWGAVNVAIAAVALSRSGGDPAAGVGLAEALRAEAGLGNVLWVNVGLDAGYAAVGATLWAVAGRGVPTPGAWRGHGQALVLQGAGLLVLDALVLVGQRARLDALVGLVGALGPTPDGVGLVVPL